jgi:hypothetical protein
VAKVFGVFMVELRPGIEEEDFETFLREEVVPKMPKLEGTKFYYLKGNRGERESKYLYVIEFPSVEARDRYFPSLDVRSEEFQQWRASFSEEQTKVWREYFEKYVVQSYSTDYTLIAQY